MSKIAPCLWFAREAEEAANFYVSLFPDSRIDHVQKNIVDTPAGTLRSTTNANHTVSSKVIMMVRPEVITLHTGSVPGEYNEVEGVVMEKYFLGSAITYRIRYADEGVLQVQGQPWSEFEVGDPIWCRFDVERSWILPSESN